jgi:putative DNA primase/helicase
MPVQAVIEGAGRKARSGQLVRMVDIPATGDDGDIIHDAHGLDPADFVRRIKRACARYFGTAGPEFVRFLCKQGTTAELGKRIQSDLEKAHRLLPQDSPQEVARVVRRFALVLVAGQFACAAGVLPFSADDIHNAVQLVLQRWLDVHGRGPMERALEQLRAFILRNEARFRDKDNTNQIVRDLVGYRDQRHRLYLLTPEGAQEALDGYSVRDVMRHLLDQGLLFVNETDRLLSGHRVSGIDRAVRPYAVRAALLGAEEAEREEEGDE